MNRITVFLEAIDKISPKLQQLGSQTQGLGAGAVMLGNLYTQAFQVAAQGLGSFLGRFSEAAEMQTQNIALAGQFSGMTRQSFQEASQMLSEMNLEIAKMAAALPGATQDYKALGMAISDSLVQANLEDGSFDPEQYRESALALTKSLGLLKASSSELQVSDVQLFFGKFIQGASESELSILKLNERMPGLMTQLQRATEKLKGQRVEFEDLTQQERVKVFEMASQALTPPEMIAALQDTASSQIEALKTSLFDQNTGVFGLLRDTYQGLEGDQSVIVAAGQALKAVLGKGGLLDTVGTTLEQMGFKGFDPMKVLYDGLTRFTDFVNDISGDAFSLDFSQIRGLGSRLAAFVNQGFDRVSEFLQSGFSSDVAASIGVNLGNLLNSGVDALGDYLSDVDWSQLGAIAVTVSIRLAQILGNLIRSIDWLQICVNLVKGFLAIREAVDGVRQKLREAILRGMAELGSIAVQWVRSRISDLWNSLKEAITALFDQIKGAINQLRSFQLPTLSLPSMPSFFGGGQQGQPTPNAASGFNVGSLFAAIDRELRSMPAGANLVVANSREAILNPQQQQNLMGMVRSRVQALPQRIASEARGAFAPVINVYGSQGQDVNQLAEAVLQKLAEQYRAFTEGLL